MPPAALVILTQEAQDNASLGAALARHGIAALSYPCLATRWLDWSAASLPAGTTLAEFSVLAFTSRRGVQGFAAQHALLGAALPRLACVGEATASEAAALLQLPCSIMGEPQTAEGLAKAIATAVRPPARVLHVRGRRGGSLFREVLESTGLQVSELVVYETIFPVLEPLGDASADLAVFASPSAAEAFFSVNPALAGTLPCVSIGPVSSARLRDLGVQRIYEAAQPCEAGLIETIVAALGVQPAQTG